MCIFNPHRRRIAQPTNYQLPGLNADMDTSRDGWLCLAGKNQKQQVHELVLAHEVMPFFNCLYEKDKIVHDRRYALALDEEA